MESKVYKTNVPEISLKFKKTGEKMVQIRNSMDIYEFLKNVYDEDIVDFCESVFVVFLNRSNKTIGWLKHSQGGLSECTIDPKVIIGTALKCGALSIILSHNHPSGERKPSNCDNTITKKIKQGCDYLDV